MIVRFPIDTWRPRPGSHHARAEIRISLEEWHDAIPNYGVKPSADLHSHASLQESLVELPLEIVRD